MNIEKIKRIGFSIALAAAFLAGAGESIASAQNLRYLDGASRIDNRWRTPEERKGFTDGKIAGRRDAEANLKRNPGGSIRYQLGSVEYRLAFQEGYDQEYRKFTDNREYHAYNSFDLRGVNTQGGYYDRSGNFHRY